MSDRDARTRLRSEAWNSWVLMADRERLLGIAASGSDDEVAAALVWVRAEIDAHIAYWRQSQ